MATKISESELALIRERRAKLSQIVYTGCTNKDDYNFTVNAPSDIDRLLDHCTALEEELKEQHEALLKVWAALGITEYTGKHVAEHVAALQEDRKETVEALDELISTLQGKAGGDKTWELLAERALGYAIHSDQCDAARAGCVCGLTKLRQQMLDLVDTAALQGKARDEDAALAACLEQGYICSQCEKWVNGSDNHECASNAVRAILNIGFVGEGTDGWGRGYNDGLKDATEAVKRASLQGKAGVNEPVDEALIRKAAAQAAQDLYAAGWLRAQPKKVAEKIVASLSRHIAATTPALVEAPRHKIAEMVGKYNDDPVWAEVSANIESARAEQQSPRVCVKCGEILRASCTWCSSGDCCYCRLGVHLP